jgi:hypothetical protein
MTDPRSELRKSYDALVVELSDVTRQRNCETQVALRLMRERDALATELAEYKKAPTVYVVQGHFQPFPTEGR